MKLNIESFLTVDNQYETKFKEKGSVFIGKIFPVKTEHEVLEILNSIKKEYYDATHHCYAYKLLNEDFKYSDDGEPNGSAGIRLLNAIEHFNLYNVAVISIRYYGGTKLGVGPLGKAYYKSAYDTIEAAEISTKQIYNEFSVKYDFSDSKTIHHFLNSFGAVIIDNKYNDKAEIIFLLKPKYASDLKLQIVTSTNGKAEIKDLKSLIIQ